MTMGPDEMSSGQGLVDDYLDRLERAAQMLPPERRIDLLAQIRSHITDARIADEVDSEADLRALLDRLGPPEEIAAAAAVDESSATLTRPLSEAEPQSNAGGPRRSIALETWSVIMLTVGSILLPVIGWLVGVVLMWSSDCWRTREKVLGTVLVPGGIGVFGILGVFGFFGASVEVCSSDVSVVNLDGSTSPVSPATSTCDSAGSWTDVLAPTALILFAVASIVVPIILLHLARSRVAEENGAAVGRPSQVDRTKQPAG